MPAHAHGVPGVLRQREGCGALVVEIKDFMFAAENGGAILAGLEHLDDRLKASGRSATRRASAAAC